MNTYHWIAIFFLADVLVFLPFIRGSDKRRDHSPKRKTKLGVS